MTLFQMLPGHKLFTQNFFKYEAPADTGGTGDSDDSSNDDTGDESDDDDEEELPRGKQSSKSVPYERFQKQNAALKEFKQLGMSPTEIVKMVNNYNQMLDTINKETVKEKDAGGQTKAQRIQGAKRQQIMDDMEDLFPGISKLAKLSQDVDGVKSAVEKTGNVSLRSIEKEAISMIPRLLENADFDTKDKAFVKEVEIQIANAFRSDPKLMSKLQDGDLSIVEEVFKTFNKSFLSKFATSKKVAKKRDLPAMLREAEGQSSGKQGRQHDESDPRQAKAAKKRDEDQSFFDLYHDLAKR